MRISDWSSDVCSSDLVGSTQSGRSSSSRTTRGIGATCGAASTRAKEAIRVVANFVPVDGWYAAPQQEYFGVGELHKLQIGRASCRERVCPYVSISVFAVSIKTKIHT